MSRYRKWKANTKKHSRKSIATTRVQAFAQYVCMSAHKARRVIDQIRGRSYEETLMLLELMPYRASYPVFKLLYSAAANATHNLGFKEADSYISKAEVNEGTIVKRLKPRARGRSYPIKKPTCHITIVLKDRTLNEDFPFGNKPYVLEDPIIKRYLKERKEERDGKKNKSTWFSSWFKSKS
uniref:Large ribosomal subunit protein uL22c n=1 Tax=Asarum canadense TaxID=28498 RepID=A0A2P1IQF6_ASACA|nr:ribosomal protein L22 [Asarum canadense]